MNGSIARRYAQALLEIGLASQAADAMHKELLLVCAAFKESPELEAALTNPSFKHAQRRAVIEELSTRLALSQPVRNLMLLLLTRGRIAALADITREHRVLVDQAAGRLRAQVVSPGPLGKDLEKRLRMALERHTGKTIILEKQEDPNLVGGIVCRIGDVVYDGSMRTQLDNLRRQLLAQ